ncbi:MAG: GIY-YIG nuclease family protein [Candidatus Zambryskibacteria bacterium]|nr:GIY-YIG nuclease family protein [Candidatus Zambryskibacteria bacterium]
MQSQDIKQLSPSYGLAKKNIKQIISKLPDAPGVYIFKRGQKILYIGKATSLRDRVRSYFRDDIMETRSPLVSKMLTQFDAIEHIRTDSVLEALVLEAHLIKKYQPEANIKEKDNKSFNFVVITKENFSRVLVMRGRELFVQAHTNIRMTRMQRMTMNKNTPDISCVFGPFPSGGQLREAMKIIRKMFPYRDSKCTPYAEQIQKKSKGLIYNISYISKPNIVVSKVGDISPTLDNLDNLKKYCKPCFNRQIGLCPGVCTGEISKKEYAEQIENIILFFEGNKKRLVKNIEKRMKSFAKNKEFEKANITKRTLFTLSHIQDVALIKDENVENRAFDTFRIESYDVAHLSGTNVVGVMTVVEDGEVKKSDYRKFKIREEPGVNDIKALSEILSRRLAHIEWPLPDLVVVDGGVAQKRVMEKILRENKMNIPVVSVVKNEYHKPREILGDKKWLVHERGIILSNSEAHRFAVEYHKKLRDKGLAM